MNKGVWVCKKCKGTNIRQHMEEGVLYSYEVDGEGTQILSSQKLENKNGWYARFLNFSCQDCGSQTEDKIEVIAIWKEI